MPRYLLRLLIESVEDDDFSVTVSEIQFSEDEGKDGENPDDTARKKAITRYLEEEQKHPGGVGMNLYKELDFPNENQTAPKKPQLYIVKK